MITVVTPSIRKAGLEIVRQALANQTYRDFEWLICSPFDPEIPEARWVKDDFKEKNLKLKWGLNHAYNALFKEAKGELIVSWQDWIWAPENTLEKFLFNWQETKGIISGVGDQYLRMGEYKPEVKVWNDPRKTDKYGSFYECNPNDNEWNLACFAKADVYEVGGMDEKLDELCLGCDQIQVVERWDDLGKKFYLDQTLESFTVRHGREDFGGEKKWNAQHGLFNGAYEKRKKELKENGEWPCLSYLKVIE